MAMNKRVSEETFGTDPVSPSIAGGGRITTFGHTHSGKIPDRGTSVNSKTGYPAKPVK
jgi:hypothetical protein